MTPTQVKEQDGLKHDELMNLDQELRFGRLYTRDWDPSSNLITLKVQTAGKDGKPGETLEEHELEPALAAEVWSNMSREYRGGWLYTRSMNPETRSVVIEVAKTDSKHVPVETLLQLELPAEDSELVWAQPFGFLKYEKR